MTNLPDLMGKTLLFALAMGAATAASAQSLPVTGMVAHPGPVALATLAPVTFTARFHTKHGSVAHSWSGPLLRDVVNAAGVNDAPGRKTHMRHCLMISGADGYGVAVAMGEIDAEGEAKQVIVAMREDGTALPAPRLIVPGDSSFARGVQGIAGIDVR